MSNVYGYLKLYSNEQDVQSQIDQLKAAGAREIFREKPSLKQTGTPQLDKLLSLVRQGDTLQVTSLDRIALNTKHLLEVVESLSSAGVAFKVLDNSIDTSSSEGDVILRLLGAIVDFEGRVVRQRQSVGIAKAKKEGRYKGRKPTARAKSDQVMALNQQGLTRQKIADELGMGVASVYRILKANAEAKKPVKKVANKPEKAPVVKQPPVKRKPTRDDSEQLSFF